MRRSLQLPVLAVFLSVSALGCAQEAAGLAPPPNEEVVDDARDAGEPGSDADGGASDPRPVPECPGQTACGVTCVDLASDPTNCGRCGLTCIIPNADPACVAGACAIGRCDEDFFDADLDLANGCEHQDTCTPGQECQTECGAPSLTDCIDGEARCPLPPETCNAADDDCNGACDDGPIPGCRAGVHRANGNGHVYSTDLAFVSSAPYNLESANYFFLYSDPIPNSLPVFLCRKPNGKRFLSTDTACEITVAPERQLGFWATASTCGAIPLYRLYHQAQENHFYTTSAPERDNARDNLGYLDEGVVGYVWRSP